MKNRVLSLDKRSDIPLYRQIYRQIEEGRRSGALPAGTILPSMNELADSHEISRETVKKAYNLLCRDGIVVSRQGKGFYVAEPSAGAEKKILVLIDKQSIYNQLMLQSLQERLAGRAHLTILLHNQDLGLLEYYLDSSLDMYDYYLVSPHFPLDKVSQTRAVRQLKRIPNRKLIMVDNWLREVPGNYGVVYQDFRHDAENGLMEGADDILRSGRLKVIVLPASLYGKVILRSVREFAERLGVGVSVSSSVPPKVEKGDVFLVLNSQLDSGLALLSRRVSDSGLEVGKDVRVISYNEFPLNEIVLGGLTTISTDFAAMGTTVADMVLGGEMKKIHNPFRMTRRQTF